MIHADVTQLLARDQINRQVILKNLNVRLLGNRVQQRALDLAARDVLCMQDSSLGMAAFLAEIEFVCAMGRGNFALGKFHAEFDQFLNPRRAFLNNRANDIFFAQTPRPP